MWNMEWKYFCAQWKPVYTALNAILRADKKIRKASLERSVLEAQVCVFEGIGRSRVRSLAR